MNIKKKSKCFVETGMSIAKKIQNGLFFIVLIVVVAVAINGCSDDSSSGIAEEKMVMVQEGYLGNYDAVTIKEVFEDTIKNGKWGGGTAKEGDYYIVEYKNSETTIQFTVYDGEETFKVSGFESKNIDAAVEAYDVKTYLDALYALYAAEFPEKRLAIDTSTDNDTLVGHIRQDQEMQNQDMEKKEAIDLYLYRMALEDTLINDFGFTKDESSDSGYSIYPTLENPIFTCSEGVVYSISLSTYSDDIYSFCGVHIGDRLENAETKLEKAYTLYETEDMPYAQIGELYQNSYWDKEKGSLVVTYESPGNIIKSLTYVTLGEDDMKDLFVEETDGYLKEKTYAYATSEYEYDFTLGWNSSETGEVIADWIDGEMNTYPFYMDESGSWYLFFVDGEEWRFEIRYEGDPGYEYLNVFDPDMNMMQFVDLSWLQQNAG